MVSNNIKIDLKEYWGFILKDKKPDMIKKSLSIIKAEGLLI